MIKDTPQVILLPPILRWDEDEESLVPATDLTITNTDIRLHKADATTEVAATNGAVHVAGGRYRVLLSSEDADTLGELRVSVSMTGTVPVSMLLKVESPLRTKAEDDAVDVALLEEIVELQGSIDALPNEETIADSVLSTAQESPIHADVRKVNGNDANPATDIGTLTKQLEILAGQVAVLEAIAGIDTGDSINPEDLEPLRKYEVR